VGRLPLFAVHFFLCRDPCRRRSMSEFDPFSNNSLRVCETKRCN
jgi:hypothetical protein